MTLFAFDLGVSDTVYFLVRIIATVGGAVVGWFVCDPLTRVIYRASAAKPTPGGLLLGSKMGGAATLALLIYFFLPLGNGGGGGFGFGPGAGGLPGKGPGDGTDKVASKDNSKTEKVNKDANEKKNDGKPNTKRDLVEIEILGGDAVQDNRYYKIKGNRYSHDELKDYFVKNANKIEVVPILTDDSVGLDRPNNPLVRLKRLAEEYEIKCLIEKRI